MEKIVASDVIESPAGWIVRLTKDWEWSDAERSWFKLVKILQRSKDPDARLWSRGGSGTHHDVPLGRDRSEALLRREALVGDLQAAGFEVSEPRAKRPTHPYRESKKLLARLIQEVLLEQRDEYGVRGGSEILTRLSSESPRDWKWEYFQKVLYFSSKELVKKPRGPMDLQNYVFKRDGKLYAVDSRRLFLMPEV